MTEEPRQPGPGGVPPQPPTPPPAGYGEPTYPPSDFGQPVTGEPAPVPPGASQPGYGQPTYPPPTPPAPGNRYAGLRSFDPASVDPLDWAIVAAGVLAFLFSFFAYFSYKVTIATFSQTGTTNAWHGALAPLATLLAVGAALLLAVQLSGSVRLGFPVRLVVLAAFGLASLLLLLALFAIPGNTAGTGVLGFKIDKGHAFGYWISLLCVLAGTGLSFKRFTDTGGKLPAGR